MSHNNLPTKPQDSTAGPQSEPGVSQTGRLAKVVGDNIQDIRGNAKWDAIKLVFQHEKWLPYVLWMWSAMSALIVALYQKLSGIPIDWLIIGLLVVFSIAPALLAFILIKRKPHSSTETALQQAPRATDVEPAGEAERAKKVEGLEARIHELGSENIALVKARDYAIEAHEKARHEIERLRHDAVTHSIQISSRDAEIEALKTKYGWVDGIIEYQRKGLRKYVLVERCEVDSSPLSSGKLYVWLTFHVRNYSMFYVSIPMHKGDEIRSSIRFNGEPISRTAKVEENKVIDLPPYRSNYFKIRQWVNPDEAKDISETLKTTGNLFDFSEAIIPIKADKFPNDEEAKLDLTSGMGNADLDNKIIELGNANARLRSELTSWQEHAAYLGELNIALGACYHAYNQSERREPLTQEAFASLKMRISRALSNRPGEPKEMADFYDELPPIPLT